MELADIIQIVIGFLSLLATIAVSFSIYRLQRKHEKELERSYKKKKQKELEDKANLFLMDNESERDYLPWCVFAANLHRLEKHTRAIYTAFCRCSEELRDEILKQAGLEIKSIKDKSWIYDCIEKLKIDIEKYNLGEDYLYDEAKYFHRSFKYYREKEWIETPTCFDPICKDNPIRKKLKINKLNIGSYTEEYFFYFVNNPVEFNNCKPIPPIDYVWNFQNLSYADEDIVCMWIMELIQVISTILYNTNHSVNSNKKMIEYTDAEVETYEDKYYETLQALYNAYYLKSNNKKGNKRKRKNFKNGGDHNAKL